jgi:periplasmic protein TonB
MKTPLRSWLALCLLCLGSLAAPISLAAETSAAPANAAFDLAELDTPPEAVKRTAPLFPAELRAQRISGKALISFVVDANGEVRDVAEVEATHPQFGHAAVQAVSLWRFKPGMKAGKKVACRLHVPILFALP